MSVVTIMSARSTTGTPVRGVPEKKVEPPPPPSEPPPAKEGLRQKFTKLLRGVILLLAVVTGVPAVTATVLGFGGTAWWGLDLLSHFRLYYVFILAATLLLTLLANHKWLALILAVSLGVNIFLVTPLFWPQQVTTDPPTGLNRLRLLHFNLFSANQSYEAVARYIDESGAAVVFLQEVTPQWLDELKTRLEVYDVQLAVPRQDNFGIVMLVNRDISEWLKVLDAREFDVTGDFARVPAIEARLKWGDRELAVLSLHALPPVNHEASRIRDAQLASTAWWVSQQTRPVIVIGDLNATPWSIGFQEMLADCSLISSQNGFGHQGTYPANLPMRIPIDHCLHSPNFVTLNRKVGPDLGSDHRPLKVTLAWRGMSPLSTSSTSGFQLSSWLPWMSDAE